MFEKFRRAIAGTTSAAVVAGMVVTGVVATATPAVAADVPLGVIDSRITGNVGTNAQGTTNEVTGNCLRSNPSGGNDPTTGGTNTTWVTSTTEAQAAHGYDNSCPGSLDLSQQSTIGFRPAAGGTVQTGTPILLGRMQHYNRPIQAESQYYKGNVELRFPSQNQTFSFPYLLNETPNQCSGTVPRQVVGRFSVV